MELFAKTLRQTAFAAASVSLLVIAPNFAKADPTEQSTSRASALRVPPGQVNRYILPNYMSETTSSTRSFAVITIMSLAPVSCDAAVSFQRGQGNTNTCVITGTLPSRTALTFCTRSVKTGVAFCNVSCPGAGLTFDVGHAYISSTNSADCSRIAVDAQQYHTRDTADAFIESESKLTVTGLSRNIGD